MSSVAQSHGTSINGMIVKEKGLLVLWKRDWYFYCYLNKGLKTIWEMMAFMCMTVTIHIHAYMFCDF
jgi:hypothetical protein